jgi:hypothetical protein
MAYGIMIPSKIAAANVDSKNRSCVSEVAYENGSIGTLSAKSTTAGEAEVWTMIAPATGAGLTNNWMVYEPEIVDTLGKYRGIDPDPRSFRNEIGQVFSAFQLSLGDLVKLSADAVAGTISTNTFVVATNGAQKLTWAAAAISGTSLKLVATEYISIGEGTLGSQRIVAYLFEVVALA